MEWKLDRFDRLSLQRLNTAQLQVVLNDQLNRIEGLSSSIVVMYCIKIKYFTFCGSGD